jgi:hypothetical protein
MSIVLTLQADAEKRMTALFDGVPLADPVPPAALPFQGLG